MVLRYFVSLNLLISSCWSFGPKSLTQRIDPVTDPNHLQRHQVILQNVVSEAVTEDDSGTKLRFMYMDEEQDRLLKEKGEYEGNLMRKPVGLKPNKVRESAGGFGGSKSTAKGKKSKTKKDEKENGEARELAVKAHAKALETDGIVRIDNVLDGDLADEFRDYLVNLRARSTSAIENGEIEDSQERFADVLLNQNRCDLKIPLGPKPVDDTLHHLLSKSIVGEVMEFVFDSYDGIGKQAELWELNCFMSNSGARRQLVHADNVCLEPIIGLKNDQEPICLTCFVALQDIDETMGSTIWMPGTHTLKAHNQFFETGIDESSTKTDTFSPKDAILKASKSVVGTIPKGTCVIFDPRVLHCAGGNTCPDVEKTRALFYVSFKNPKIDNPGCPSTSGYGIAPAEFTLVDLKSDLEAEQAGAPTRRLQFVANFP